MAIGTERPAREFELESEPGSATSALEGWLVSIAWGEVVALSTSVGFEGRVEASISAKMGE